MKVIKFICLPLLLLILLSGTALAAPASAPTISVELNNSTISTDMPPYLTQGTTMVPLNVVKHIPGITVAWSNATKTVTIDRSGVIITLVAGHKTALIGTKQAALPVASVLVNGRVMVPIRFIAEAADAHVAWNAATRIVYVAKADEALITQLQSANLGKHVQQHFIFPASARLSKSLSLMSHRIRTIISRKAQRAVSSFKAGLVFRIMKLQVIMRKKSGLPK